MTDPIFDAPFLIGLCVWLAIALLVGRYARHRTGSMRLGAVIALALFVVPMWDLPVGLAMYHKYVGELGGTRIFKSVEAEGYVESTGSGVSFTPLGLPLFMPDLPEPSANENVGGHHGFAAYAYRELRIAETSMGGAFVTRPGYWQFDVEPRGHPSCAPFEAWAMEYKVREQNRALDRWCLVATRRDSPRSRYLLEYSPRSSTDPLFGHMTALPGPSLVPPVLAVWERVIDRETGAVLAQSYALRYNSWIPMPILDEYRPLSWHTVGSGPGFLQIQNVVQPLNNMPK